MKNCKCNVSVESVARKNYSWNPSTYIFMRIKDT